jgi:EmrB/QacA subfamily drug resistance transporter
VSAIPAIADEIRIHNARTTPGQVLAIVSAGLIMANLDLFIVNIALPNIRYDFGNPALHDMSWILNGYAIVYASLLVFFGRLVERHRRELSFLVGIALFTAASAACAAATGVWTLVAFRLVQAAGAALMTPTSLGLLLASYPPERRAGAVRTWTAIGGFAAAFGPVAGGLLLELSWRWIFIVNVPIGLAALVVGWRKLPHVPGHHVPQPDALGAVLVTAGVGALTFGLVKINEWGWDSAGVLASLAFAAVLLVLFAAHCARAANPLIEPALFRLRAFTGATFALVPFATAFGAMLLALVLWEEGAWNWSPLQAGLAIAPGPFLVPVTALLVAGRLIKRFGTAPVVTLGLIVFAAGCAWWAIDVTLTPNLVAALGGITLTGIGVGLTMPTLMGAAAGSLPPSSFATGSAVVNMIRQTGMAVGIAGLIAIIGTPGGSAADHLGAFRNAWWAMAFITLLGLVPTFLMLRERPTAGSATKGIAKA